MTIYSVLSKESVLLKCKFLMAKEVQSLHFNLINHICGFIMQSAFPEYFKAIIQTNQKAIKNCYKELRSLTKNKIMRSLRILSWDIRLTNPNGTNIDINVPLFPKNGIILNNQLRKIGIGTLLLIIYVVFQRCVSVLRSETKFYAHKCILKQQKRFISIILLDLTRGIRAAEKKVAPNVRIQNLVVNFELVDQHPNNKIIIDQ